jgi:hypothetical protein
MVSAAAALPSVRSPADDVDQLDFFLGKLEKTAKPVKIKNRHVISGALVAENSASVLFAHLIGDAGAGEAHEFGEGRVRPT